MTRGQMAVLWVFGVILAIISLLTVSLPGTVAFFVILGGLLFISFGKK